MGCFSFMCKECGKPILSGSFSGQKVKLYLLDKGKILQEMEGQYDSYGRVFNAQFDKDHKMYHPDVNDGKSSSILWNLPWAEVCDLIFANREDSGIAAIHSKCFKNTPITKSADDPNQGWGDNSWKSF